MKRTLFVLPFAVVLMGCGGTTRYGGTSLLRQPIPDSVRVGGQIVKTEQESHARDFSLNILAAMPVNDGLVAVQTGYGQSQANASSAANVPQGMQGIPGQYWWGGTTTTSTYGYGYGPLVDYPVQPDQRLLFFRQPTVVFTNGSNVEMSVFAAGDQLLGVVQPYNTLGVRVWGFRAWGFVLRKGEDKVGMPIITVGADRPITYYEMR